MLGEKDTDNLWHFNHVRLRNEEIKSTEDILERSRLHAYDCRGKRD